MLVTPQEPSGPITISFGTAIQGFGVTIDDAYNNDFTGTIEAFHGNTSLGSYTNSGSDALMFLGVLDGTADITSVQIGTTNISSNDNFAFGNLSLVDSASMPTPVGSTVPEPGSVTTALAGLAGFYVLRLKANRSK
jgi:hypothetical protein